MSEHTHRHLSEHTMTPTQKLVFLRRILAKFQGAERILAQAEDAASDSDTEMDWPDDSIENDIQNAIADIEEMIESEEASFRGNVIIGPRGKRIKIA